MNRTDSPEFNRLIENYEKFVEVLREEKRRESKYDYSKRRISKVSYRKTCFWI